MRFWLIVLCVLWSACSPPARPPSTSDADVPLYFRNGTPDTDPFNPSSQPRSGQPVFRANTIACISPTLLEQHTRALVANDRRGLDYLMANGCIIPKAGIEVSILDRSLGTAHVRAYPPGVGAIELWTYIEGIQQ